MSFFVVTRDNWARVCKLGVNPAAAYLVLARGTQRDDISTSWSADAVSRHSHMSWRKAKRAIEDLVNADLVERSGPKTRPRYKLTGKSKDDPVICLPNEFVTGEDRPPIARLRGTQQVDTLELCVNLYAAQDLIHEGGLPRDLIRGEYERKRLKSIGQYTVYGFSETRQICWSKGPLERFNADDKAWGRINTLFDLGLLERVPHLVEAPETGELIHAIDGDEYATEVSGALWRIYEALPEPFDMAAEQYEFVVPILRSFPEATIEDVYRLRYRAKTRGTSAWLANHVKSCREAFIWLSAIAEGELNNNRAAGEG